MLDRLMDKYKIETEVVTETTRYHKVFLDSEDMCKMFQVDEDPTELRWEIYHDSGSYHKNEDEYFSLRAFKGEEQVFNYEESYSCYASGKLQFEKRVLNYLTECGYEPSKLHLIYPTYCGNTKQIIAGWSDPVVRERNIF